MRRYIEIPIRIIKIENDGFHIMISGTINDKKANFIIDTGASRTVFDKTDILDFIEKPDFSEKDGISAGVGGSEISSFIFVIGKLSFGSLVINDYQGVAIDMSNIHDSYSMLKLPKINGIIGGDILKKYKAIINYKSKKLRLTPKS